MIRQAKEHDLDALAELMGHVQAIHAEAHPDIFKSEMDRDAVKLFFTELLAKPGNVVLVHESDGTADGYAWYEIVERPEHLTNHARRHGYLHHISVSPEARHGGIGKALVDDVRARLKAGDIDRLGVDYWAFNTRASQFFAKLGFLPQRHIAFAAL